MTPSPLRIDATAKLRDAQRLMAEKKIRHLPVFRAGRVVGMITHQRISITCLEGGSGAGDRPVESAMASDVLKIPPTMALDAAVRSLSTTKHGCALVVDGDSLLGIFTAVDALRAPSRMAAAGARH